MKILVNNDIFILRNCNHYLYIISYNILYITIRIHVRLAHIIKLHYISYSILLDISLPKTYYLFD